MAEGDKAPETPVASESTTMRLIDVIRSSSVSARRSITVPEWGGATLWFRKMTIADMKAVEERAPATAQDRNLILLVNKAEDEAGRPLFTQGDKHWLEHDADLSVVLRVITFMHKSSYESAEEAKTEVVSSPPSASA